MRVTSSKVFGACAVLTLLSGCGHVPPTTVYKLMTHDVLTTDPAQIRAAARYPAQVMPRPGGAKLTITTKPPRPGEPEVRTFILVEATAPSDLGELATYQRDGYPVTAYKLAAADVDALRGLLNTSKIERANGVKRASSIGVSVDACHTGSLPVKAILASTYLKLDAASGYMTVLDDIDLRKEISAADLTQNIPPCAIASR